MEAMKQILYTALKLVIGLEMIHLEIKVVTDVSAELMMGKYMKMIKIAIVNYGLMSHNLILPGMEYLPG